MASVIPPGPEGVGLFYNLMKRNSSKLQTADQVAEYILNNFYDGDTQQARRADLKSAISHCFLLAKGTI